MTMITDEGWRSNKRNRGEQQQNKNNQQDNDS